MSTSSQSKPGSTADRLQPPDSSQHEFKPLIQAECTSDTGFTGHKQARFCHLGFAKNFQNFSAEEVRLADYQRGNVPIPTTTKFFQTPLYVASTSLFSAQAPSLASTAATKPFVFGLKGEASKTAPVNEGQNTSQTGTFSFNSSALSSALKFPAATPSPSDPETKDLHRAHPTFRMQKHSQPLSIPIVNMWGSRLAPALLSPAVAQQHQQPVADTQQRDRQQEKLNVLDRGVCHPGHVEIRDRFHIGK